MMDEQKFNIKKGEVVIAFMKGKTYSKDIINICRQLADKFGGICYVSLNKPYEHFVKSFESENIDLDKFYFLAIKSKPTDKIITGNCTLIKSISSITELNLAITTALKAKNIDCLVFDSLSTMMIYHDVMTVTKFIHQMILNVRSSNCTGVFTCLVEDIKTSVIRDVSMFADKIVDLAADKTTSDEVADDILSDFGNSKKN